MIHISPIDDSGYYDRLAESFGHVYRFYFNIKRGVPNSRDFGSNNPDADGIPGEINLEGAALMPIDGVLVPLELSHFHPDDLEMVREEIDAEVRP